MAHIFGTPYVPPPEPPSFLDAFDFDITSLAQDIQAQRIAKRQVAFERDDAEVEALDRARPLGAEKPRDEPKSIDDPTPPGRIRWEPPRKRYVAPKPAKCAF
jgi:hypothetical protein